jgi:hypothetical protein
MPDELKPEDDREVLDAVSPRPALISKMIYAEVEEVMRDNPGISRQEAFRRSAKKSGRALGAVSANYYREARRRRHESHADKDGTEDGGGATSELEALARQLTDNIARLVELVSEQQHALAQERERIERAKRAIADA